MTTDTADHVLPAPIAHAVTVTLDQRGRCCGRKPLTYRRPAPGYLFCDRCDASFTLDGKQQPNWAWLAVPGGFWPPPQMNELHLADPHRKARQLLAERARFEQQAQAERGERV